jgi:molecular chaperone GrpE
MIKDANEHKEQPIHETTAPVAGADAAGTILTADEIEALKARAGKADEHWDRLLRVSADFDNYKKRAARDVQEARRFANESLLQKLIPVVDNFDMALQSASTPAGASADSLKAGVAMIYSQLKSVMAETGLEEIDATDKLFDPNLHEAVSQQETAEVPEGKMIQQLRKGYRLRERLVRPASVIVARKPAA